MRYQPGSLSVRDRAPHRTAVRFIVPGRSSHSWRNNIERDGRAVGVARHMELYESRGRRGMPRSGDAADRSVASHPARHHVPGGLDHQRTAERHCCTVLYRARLERERARMRCGEWEWEWE